MPYGTVNLRYGVPPGETPITCTAGVGTFIVEFGTLSRLTGAQSCKLQRLFTCVLTVVLCDEDDIDTLSIVILTSKRSVPVCLFLAF